MDPHRKTAMIVGVLFIVATVAGMMAAVFTEPILDDPDYLVNTSSNENELILGALLILIMGVAVVGIAVMIFPILKNVNEGLALGYVGFRTIECVCFVVSVMALLLLLTLSQEYVEAEPLDATSFETQGAILLAVQEWSNIPTDIVFGLSCLMVFYLFYQSKLVPRPLSAWGFVGGIFMLVSAALGAFGVIGAFDASTILLNLPIAALEMVLAVWLIVKGFSPSAIASLSARVSEGPN
jgi:hypothetical protein